MGVLVRNDWCAAFADVRKVVFNEFAELGIIRYVSAVNYHILHARGSVLKACALEVIKGYIVSINLGTFDFVKNGPQVRIRDFNFLIFTTASGHSKS